MHREATTEMLTPHAWFHDRAYTVPDDINAFLDRVKFAY